MVTDETLKAATEGTPPGLPGEQVASRKQTLVFVFASWIAPLGRASGPDATAS